MDTGSRTMYVQTFDYTPTMTERDNNVTYTTPVVASLGHRNSAALPIPLRPSPDTTASYMVVANTSPGSGFFGDMYNDDSDPDGLSMEGDGYVEGEEAGTIRGSGEPTGLASGSTQSLDKETGAPPKKPRTTLGRGRACVPCRVRKLKCSGEKPCANCMRAQSDCQYQEITRRKPRGVLLEERVAELEQRLLELGEIPPPSKLPPRSGSNASISPATIPGELHIINEGLRVTSSSISGSLSLSPRSPAMLQPQPSPHLQLSLHPPNFPANMPTMNSGGPEIPPCCPLEFALISFVLPYTPYLLMPLHRQRFLGLVGLPGSDIRRPHPALMYILFAEAARILEAGLPAPNPPPLPRSVFPPQSPTEPLSIPQSPTDRSYMLAHVRGMSTTLLERARAELENGIRSVDLPFDLARAAVGIARYLYSLGRFIEGWNIPVARLFVSCGLHRNIGTIVPPSHVPDHGLVGPKHAQSYQYAHSNSAALNGVTGADKVPVLRMRPVILPPARDEIDVTERVMAFWAAKAQDWEACTGWGWSLSLADEECTTQWPWGSGTVEVRPPGVPRPFYNLADLHDLHSSMHTSGMPDMTYVLALKSLALLHRASHLFDLPISSVPTLQSPRPTHIPPLSAVQSIEAALALFRGGIPFVFRDFDPGTRPPDIEPYDGPSDPWWIMLHANLYTAEMLMYKELAHHSSASYESAVSCARALVKLVGLIRPEQWCHVDMIVALDLSLAARFLNKEAQRLATNGHGYASKMTSDEAELLRLVLARDCAKYLPMAGLHDLIIQRVREGWPEKEGEYERV